MKQEPEQQGLSERLDNKSEAWDIFKISMAGM